MFKFYELGFVDVHMYLRDDDGNEIQGGKLSDGPIKFVGDEIDESAIYVHFEPTPLMLAMATPAQMANAH